MTAPDHLRQAAHHAAEAARLLNANKTICDCCGLARYEDWDQFKVYESVDSMSQKLRSAAARLERLERGSNV